MSQSVIIAKHEADQSLWQTGFSYGGQSCACNGTEGFGMEVNLQLYNGSSSFIALPSCFHTLQGTQNTAKVSPALITFVNNATLILQSLDQ